MGTKRKTKRENGAAKVAVNFRADPQLIAQFREIVEREERTVSHALRHHMRERVERHREAA